MSMTARLCVGSRFYSDYSAHDPIKNYFKTEDSGCRIEIMLPVVVMVSDTKTGANNYLIIAACDAGTPSIADIANNCNQYCNFKFRADDNYPRPVTFYTDTAIRCCVSNFIDVNAEYITADYIIIIPSPDYICYRYDSTSATFRPRAMPTAACRMVFLPTINIFDSRCIVKIAQNTDVWIHHTKYCLQHDVDFVVENFVYGDTLRGGCVLYSGSHLPATCQTNPFRQAVFLQHKIKLSCQDIVTLEITSSEFAESITAVDSFEPIANDTIYDMRDQITRHGYIKSTTGWNAEMSDKIYNEWKSLNQAL